MKRLKNIVKAIFAILIIIIVVALVYVAYVFISYDRIDDKQKLKVNEPNVKNENVSDVVRKVCSEYKKLFDSNHIVLREEYDIDTYAQINGKLLKQAVSNYVSNAIKHSDEKSQVTVRVLDLNETVRIEVENMGKHIDELYKDKIWDIFYSGDVNETLNGQKGSGLGLYLVKSIAKLHNAEYGFENTDNGVIFYITLKKVQKKDHKQLN